MYVWLMVVVGSEGWNNNIVFLVQHVVRMLDTPLHAFISFNMVYIYSTTTSSRKIPKKGMNG